MRIRPHRKTKVSREGSSALGSQPKERPKGVSDGQQGFDIPCTRVPVMEGRSRLTKADEWKCLSKQWCDMSQMLISYNIEL